MRPPHLRAAYQGCVFSSLHLHLSSALLHWRTVEWSNLRGSILLWCSVIFSSITPIPHYLHDTTHLTSHLTTLHTIPSHTLTFRLLSLSPHRHTHTHMHTQWVCSTPPWILWHWDHALERVLRNSKTAYSRTSKPIQMVRSANKWQKGGWLLFFCCDVLHYIALFVFVSNNQLCYGAWC